MRVLVTEIKTDRHGLGVVVSLKHRHLQFERVVWVPWKWLAIDDVDQHLSREWARTRRVRQKAQQPWLPLESWE